MVYIKDLVYIKRDLEGELERVIKSGKEFAVITGPRQAGKTTMVEHFLSKYKGKKISISFEDLDILNLFNEDIKGFCKMYIEPYDIIFIDEFQHSPDGRKLKFIFDKYSNKRVIISGSSSINLIFKSVTPLVGRIRILELFPLSFKEFLRFKNPNLFKTLNYHWSKQLSKLVKKYLEEFILYGGYPRVVLEKDESEKKAILKDLLRTLIARDFHEFLDYRSVSDTRKLLILLANATNITNFSNLSDVVGRSIKWVEEKIQFLEDLYIIKQVTPFYKNKKTEVSKRPKIYFIDNGILHTSLENYSINGKSVENYVFSEFLKYNYSIKYWRTKSKAEVDFILNDKIPVEVKLRKAKMTRSLRSFIEKYKVKKYYVAASEGNTKWFLPLERIWKISNI